ncbi:MAG: hypothetical protein ACP5E7_06110 [Hydrogenobaculum sp.]
MIESLEAEDYEATKTIDAFVLRFTKLQDHMGQKLFKAFLDKIGEYKDNMSFIDILDRLEKLSIINSTDEWLEMRSLRNRMTHEYPNELYKIKLEINIAISKIPTIENTIKNIMDYLIKRNLI